MSKILPAGELRFDFSKSLCSIEYDKIPMVVTSMKRVDFIVSEPERLLLIEVKDPTRYQGQKNNSYKASIDINVNSNLVPKARDTYTALHLFKKNTKPLWYIVYIDISDNKNDSALLLQKHEALRERLRGEFHRQWRVQYIANSLVLNETQWNKYFPQYPISRKYQ